MKVLWRGKSKTDAELQLERYIQPADPDAVLKKEGDSWVIVGKAMMGSQPVVIEKE